MDIRIANRLESYQGVYQLKLLINIFQNKKCYGISKKSSRIHKPLSDDCR